MGHRSFASEQADLSAAVGELDGAHRQVDDGDGAGGQVSTFQIRHRKAVVPGIQQAPALQRNGPGSGVDQGDGFLPLVVAAGIDEGRDDPHGMLHHRGWLRCWLLLLRKMRRS